MLCTIYLYLQESVKGLEINDYTILELKGYNLLGLLLLLREN